MIAIILLFLTLLAIGWLFDAVGAPTESLAALRFTLGRSGLERKSALPARSLRGARSRSNHPE